MICAILTRIRAADLLDAGEDALELQRAVRE
jgi:hypothetical protein